MPEASATVDLSASMSSAQATDELAALQAAYDPPPAGIHASTATEASQRLAELGETPDFLRKLQSGDLKAKEEWQHLCALKASAAPTEFTVEPIIETTTGDTGLTRRDLISVAADMRADGFPDAAIEHIIGDGRFTVEAVVAAQHWLPRMEADPNLLCPEAAQWGWPEDREYQMRCFRTIAAIGTMDSP
jgi:hypothetical protein